MVPSIRRYRHSCQLQLVVIDLILSQKLHAPPPCPEIKPEIFQNISGILSGNFD